ncbi:NAD(P)-dependent alcohol dehydrogenase [soil metagenome]
MRAARYHDAHRPLELEDIERPTPGPGQVLVRVEAAGVCGTELHFLEGLLTPAKSPIVLGHEVAGTVAETGDGVDGWSEGDRVAVHYFHPCRLCRPCRTGYEHLCDRPEGFLAFLTDGGFAEYVAVPHTALVAVPEALSFDQAAPLCCGGATALHALAVSGLRMDDTALVFGCGGVGLALVQVLRRAGIRVLATSRSEAKRTAAARAGAAAVIDASAEDVAGAARAATGGRGVDAVFETVGRTTTMRTSLASLAKRGALVFVGYSFDPLEVGPLELVVPELRILTAVGNTRAELVAALERAAAGELEIPVHEVAPLDEVNRVLDALAAGKVVGRAILRP